MFTTKFKVLLGTLLGVVVVGGLTVNQVTLERQVQGLNSRLSVSPTVSVLVSVTPSATPSATPVIKRLFTPVTGVTALPKK